MQESASVGSELERLQEGIVAERSEMLTKMAELRESFELEAVELRKMLDCDKAKLRQQLE